MKKSLLKKIMSSTIFKMIMIISILILPFIILLFLAEMDEHKYNRWYNSLSVEERAKEDARVKEEKIKERKARTKTYEVLSVYQYIYTTTNKYGGITDTQLAYAFTYKTSSGKLLTEDCFIEDGYTCSIKLGKKNKYVIYDRKKFTLYLTEETLRNIKAK